MKNRKALRILAIAAALMAVAMMLASCSAKENGMVADKDIYDGMADAPNSGSTLPSYTEKEEMAGSVTDDSTSDKEEGTGENDAYSPKIIKTATLEAETQNFTNAVAEIEASVKTLGGYIESCNVQNRNYSYQGVSGSTRYANYVLRIPADKLDEFLVQTGELLNVTSTNSKAEDISGEYYDIQARISVLETERQLVEKMLSEATSINTMITLEERLYDIIYEIESYKTAIKVYDSKVAYSTVTLNVREVVDLTPIDADDSFGSRFKNAISESWNNTVSFFEDTAIFLVYAAPVLGVMAICLVGVAVIVLVVLVIVRKCIRKARGRKEAN